MSFNSHKFHMLPNMDHIFGKKRKKWGNGDEVEVRSLKSSKVSDEERIYNSIENGKLTDRDIHDIQRKGDSRMMRTLEKKAEENKRRKSDLEDRLGIRDRKLFDGVDNNGNLYRDIPLSL